MKTKEMYDFLSQTEKDYLSKLNNIIELSKPSYNKKKEIEKNYSISLDDKFNFFEAISEQYKKENLHSDLMAMLLNPFTKEIGNKNYLNEFLDLIDDKKSGIKEKFADIDDISVERENGRIDILIYNRKYAVIIENKINGAPDMPNQLGRYYGRFEHPENKEKKKEVLKIVYVTLTSEDKSEPTNFNEYEKPYKDYVPEIRKKLIHLPAVSKDLGKRSVIGWLRDCSKNQEYLDKNNKINKGKIFIEQYEQLLEYLGGDVLMLNVNKDVIRKIYVNKENIKLTEDLVEIWNKRAEAIFGLLVDDFCTSQEFVYGTLNEYKVLYKTSEDNIIKYVFTLDDERKNIHDIQIGFTYKDKKITDQEGNQLLNKLPELNYLNKEFDDKGWAYGNFNIDCLTYDEIKKIVQDFFDK